VNPAALASALRVLAVAAERELLLDLPKAVVVYGRTLHVRELEWLIAGLGATHAAPLAERGPTGETYEISGVLLGRLVKVQLTEDRYADLNAARRRVGVR
jgi:hypothetical protein